MKNKTKESQMEIYRKLFDENRGTPMAVSSESLAHKFLRFKQIAGIFDQDDDFTIHDIGMGLADFYQFLLNEFPIKKIIYSGSEILEEYVNESKLRFPGNSFYLRDIAEESFKDKYDYIIMSGLFHQRRDTKIRDWEKFSQIILKNSFEMCNKGIAFNFISPFVDFYQTQVYYCNLPKLLNFINDELSRFFVIKHNYALFEFTVYVYKDEFIKSKHYQPEFVKYF
jgi:hypothetical protein